MMAKLHIIFTLLCFSTLIANSLSLSQDNKAKTIPPFRFYLLEIVSGPGATLYEVARASISTVPTSFGITYATDGIVTSSGPDPSSRKLGRIQGTITNTGLNEPADVVNYSVMFDTGKYKGSTLIIAGQRLIFVPNQEIPIAGGTGAFRGARGYAISSFISNDPTTNTTVFVYDIFIKYA